LKRPAILLAIPALLLAACGGEAPARLPTFTDVAAEAGITFVHNNGARGKKYLPETMGSGCAFLDYDGDGWLDIFLVNGVELDPGAGKPTYSALYRNLGNGQFEDVTKKAGLEEAYYGLGAAAADYDNDGDTDLFVSALGPDRLYRNRGDGTFEEVAESAGVADRGFGSSAAFLDYDNDGWLDLVVANYVKWSREDDLFCTLDGTTKSYCTPESYQGDGPRLYRNTGDGRFEDVSEASGILNPSGKSLGIAVMDLEPDGNLEIAIANDTEPNYFYENEGNGKFTEVGSASGIAYSESGVARGAMGIDAADYDDSGNPSIVIGNFSNQMIGLYHNEGKGLFIDDAARSGLGAPSLLTLAFGTFFFDYDLDGHLDVFVANGHVADDIDRVQQEVKYAQPPHLFRNVGEGRFEDVAPKSGEALTRTMVARGAAYGDFDRDGDLDVLVTTNGGPAHLFRNDGGSASSWIRVRLRGVKSNRDGIGARVTATVGGHGETRLVKSGSSYCSASELPVTFGFGPGVGSVDSLAIVWPSGKRQQLEKVPTGREILVDEEQGIVPEG